MMTPSDVRPFRRTRSFSRPRLRPRLEPMEARALLSTLTVSNNHDSGNGSLRYELGQAVAGDSIDFASGLTGQTITLTSGPLTIPVGLTIDGPGASALTVSGGGTQGVFVVPAGVTATINGLTIADGLAVQGAGIDNFGTLTIDGCTLAGNTAVGGSGDSTTPDAANGGGIANEVGASLTLYGSLLKGNVATASPGNDSFGGGLLNLGAATILGSVFTGNQATGGGSSSYYDGSYGGAISSFGFPPSQLYGSTLNIIGSTFAGNEVDAATGADYGDGGALDLEFGAVVTINDSAFTGNVATGGPGTEGAAGAINIEGCNLKVTDTGFTGNQAIGGDGLPADGPEGIGGAISTDGSGTTVVSFANCRFTNNLAQGGPGVAGAGGAIANYGGALSDSLETMTLTGCTLIGNQAIGGTGTGAVTPYANLGGGGAIDSLDGGNLTIIDSQLIGNQAIGGSDNPNTSGLFNGFGTGGAIENSDEYGVSTMTLINTAVLDNLARAGTNSSGPNGQGIGGGIDNSGSTLNINGGALSGNRVIGASGAAGVAAGDGFGGGLADWDGGTATLTNVAIQGNLAQGGNGAPGAVGGDGLGGGIAESIGSVLGSSDSASLTMSGGILSGNIALGGAGGSGANGGNGWGGGAFFATGAVATLTDAVIILNAALGGPAGSGGTDGQGLGGGLYVASGASVTLKSFHLVAFNFASTAGNDIEGSVSYA